MNRGSFRFPGKGAESWLEKKPCLYLRMIFLFVTPLNKYTLGLYNVVKISRRCRLAGSISKHVLVTKMRLVMTN